MKLKELTEKSGLKALNSGSSFATEVTGGYASDLLSDVMGHADRGAIWITLQIHRNIVAVASLRELAAIVLVNGAEPEPETLALARKEDVTILVSDLPAFELCGRIWQLLAEK